MEPHTLLLFQKAKIENLFHLLSNVFAFAYDDALKTITGTSPYSKKNEKVNLHLTRPNPYHYCI